MGARLNCQRWYTRLAAVVASADGFDVADATVAAVSHVVAHEGTCLLAFHDDRPPEVLHHTLSKSAARHYLDRYLAGPYLLDPLYQAALETRQPMVLRFRDARPDRFTSSSYYRRYCERTHLVDEIDYLTPVSAHTTLALVVGRRKRRFAGSELADLRTISPLLYECLRRIWAQAAVNPVDRRGQQRLHRHLTRCFEEFGAELLTERERQVAVALLRGHSAKSVARLLAIAPGTVMVHRKNLYTKLGIRSQAELFSRFLEALEAG